MRYPAPLNCLAGSLPSLIQFRIVLVDTFRYPAALCTVRGSSPSARFTSRPELIGIGCLDNQDIADYLHNESLRGQGYTRGRLAHCFKSWFLIACSVAAKNEV